jgi:hypothetical protein
MADAAKSARGAFTDIKAGATEMSGHIGSNMFASRHAIMAVSEAFGDTMPRAITAFLVHIGPLGAALEAAFPFAAIGLAAVLLIEHLAKLRAEGEKLTEDQVRFGTAVLNAFNQLDERLIQAGIKADELRDDHLGALAKKLELIDKQSMSELVHSFEEVAKAADVVFGDMQSHWYTFGIGSDGAKHALTTFKVQYDSLLAQGKNAEAADLLKGTRESAEKVLAMQEQAKSSLANQKGKAGTDVDDQIKFAQAMNVLKAAGVGYTDKEVKSQQTLVDALKAQVDMEDKIAALKKLDQGNAKTETQKAITAEAEKAAREKAEAFKKEGEELRKIFEAVYKDLVQTTDDGERAAIAATREGSQERLAAVDDAIKEEQSLHLEDTAYYRELLISRVNLVRQMAEEEARLQAEAGREAADHSLKMAELSVAADKEGIGLINSGRRVLAEERVAQEVDFANREFALKKTALDAEIAALDSGAKDYENKLRQIQDKELQLVQAHENEVAAIRDKAQIDQNQRTQAALQAMENMFASGFTQVLMGHRSFASMMSSIGDQVVSGMLDNALKSIMANDMTKESDAAKAAREAFKTGVAIPVVGPVMGPIFGAAAFAAMMAFEGGGVVPGVGRGDVVPAMLTPGEGIVPGSMMDRLNEAAKAGFGGTTNHHFHIRPTYNLSALDASGMERVLEKHSATLERHFQGVVRRMNR